MWKEADVVFLIYLRVCPEGVRILPGTYRKNEEVLCDRVVQSGTHPKGRGVELEGFNSTPPPPKKN